MLYFFGSTFLKAVAILMRLEVPLCFMCAFSFHFHSSHSSLDAVFAWVVVAVSI